ncbi:MAG: hypothetical protein Kow0092_31110 [Deferrisomatales bacterium]
MGRWSAAALGCTFMLLAATAHGQTCLFAEPGPGDCFAPLEIPGTVGQHVVLTDAGDGTDTGSLCGASVGNLLYFSLTPEVSGPVRVSTCHPATAYDTVLRVARGVELCEAGSEVACNDDTAGDRCVNTCTGAGSQVTFDATAGTEYIIRVGSYGENEAGCPLCLGLVATVGEPCGEAPRNLFCQTARELPGSVGTHSARIDGADALPQPDTWACGGEVGYPLWFAFTAETDGTATFSTCRFPTAYDTVVRVFTGECGGLLAAVACNDDAEGPGCSNACGPSRGSRVTFPVRAGGRYFVEVGSYGVNQAGCDLCLGASLTIAQCESDADCDDGSFCTGREVCREEACVPGEPPCAWHELCDEEAARCAPRPVEVPGVVGMPYGEAALALETGHLSVGSVGYEPSRDVPAAHVLGQAPAEGATLPWGAAVDLTVSAGPPACLCPECTRECRGDFDGDGDVDQADRRVFEADFGRTDCEGDCPGDFDGDGDVDRADREVFEAEFGRADCACRAEARGLGPEGSARVLVPVFLYHLERYFLGLTDGSEVDRAVAAAMDEDPVYARGDLDRDRAVDGADAARMASDLARGACPEGCPGDLTGDGRVDGADLELWALDLGSRHHEALRRALTAYRALSEEEKLLSFDPETVRLTQDPRFPLDWDLVRSRLARADPSLARLLTPLGAPSHLEARNNSKFADPDLPGTDSYEIELGWVDNASAEDGMRVYRAFKAAGAGTLGPFQLRATLGPNATHYVDTLTQPANQDDQYCYHVRAFRTDPDPPPGKPPALLESDPSPAVCSYYDPYHALDLPPDQDHDGIPDDADQCVAVPGILPHGCPDKDTDGIPNDEDMCEEAAGWPQGPYIPANRHGCPQRYNIRWMGMEVLNNSSAYAFPSYAFYGSDGKRIPYNEPYRDLCQCDGEEPYLLFAVTNGMTVQGAKVKWLSRWCCGDCVDVKAQATQEPDADICGEETYNTPALLQDLRAHGFTVFPEWQKQFAEIDAQMGLALVLTLMERDDTITLPAQQAKEWSDAFAAGGAVVGAVSACVGGPGSPGCLLAVGKALKSVIETIFGFLKSDPPPVTVKDPDDFMGSTLWTTTEAEAYWNTANYGGDGAYGFFFDVPFSYQASCLGWEPCTPAISVPITMRARVKLCLYREGVPESSLPQVCPPYKDVRPEVK